jgi:hypothetical protein
MKYINKKQQLLCAALLGAVFFTFSTVSSAQVTRTRTYCFNWKVDYTDSHRGDDILNTSYDSHSIYLQNIPVEITIKTKRGLARQWSTEEILNLKTNSIGCINFEVPNTTQILEFKVFMTMETSNRKFKILANNSKYWGKDAKILTWETSRVIIYDSQSPTFF